MKKVMLFFSLVYFEVILIFILLLFSWNVFKDSRNLFDDYIYVNTLNEISDLNKEKKNIITLNSKLTETGKAIVNDDGELESIYCLVELEDAYILFNIHNKQLKKYKLNEINDIFVKIKPFIGENEIITELENQLMLDKEISTQFELVEYSITERKQLLVIFMIVIVLISIEAFFRGGKSIKNIYKKNLVLT